MNTSPINMLGSFGKNADRPSGTRINSLQRWKLIREHCAFHAIADRELERVLEYFKLVSSHPGQLVTQEGLDTSSDLLLVLDGELEVTKKDLDQDEKVATHEARFTIAKLFPGDIVGEFSFITADARCATIKSVTHCELLSISRVNFEVMEREQPKSYTEIVKNLMRHMAERIKQTSTNEVRSLKIELQNSLLNSRSNLFFSYVIGLLCVYNLVIHYIISLSGNQNSASLISAIIILLFGAGLVLMVQHSKLPLNVVGLTTKNWRRAVNESLPWTALIISVSIAAKWILIHTVHRYSHLPLFDFDFNTQKFLVFNFFLYGFHSPIQEFIARGVLQGSLQHFFTGKNVAFRAIIVSNALFSATHVHIMNGWLALMVFIPGLFWGWLYSRHKNLIGVAISHLLIGWTLLFFLDLESLL